MKNKQSLALVLMIILSVALGCDSWVSLKGRVVDEDGKPVAGARIVVTQNDHKREQLSGADGKFDYFDSTSPIGSSTIKLTITKDGFEKYEGQYNSRDLRDVTKINPTNE